MEKNVISLSYGQVVYLDTLERRLLECCQIFKVPMFCSVVISNSESDTKYINIVYGCQSHSVFLADDHIREHILIADGFEVTDKEKKGFGIKIHPKVTSFKLYKDEIQILKKAILDIYNECVSLGIPCFITAAVESDENDTVYVTRVFNGHDVGSSEDTAYLTNDQITKHVRVLDGFTAISRRNVTTIDLEGVLYGVQE